MKPHHDRAHDHNPALLSARITALPALGLATALALCLAQPAALAHHAADDDAASSAGWWRPHTTTATTTTLLQDSATSATTTTVEHRESSLILRAGLSFTYQFASDLSAGNHDVAISRFGTGLSLETPLGDDATLTVAMGYQVDDYDFGGTTGFFAASNWGDVHTIDFSIIYARKLTEQLAIFGGPVVQSARESGADFGDSLMAGGVIGATWIASPDLVIGAGLGIISQLEDSVRVFPIIRAHWQINDQLTLGTADLPIYAGPSLLELGYQLSDEWRLSLGAGYRFKRFRLDDSGPIPDGIGEERAIPIYLAARWRPQPNITVGGRIGFSFDGELRAEDSSGTLLSKNGYDNALFLGVWGAITF